MNYLNTTKLFTITLLCIINSFCFGQSTKSGICTLGDIANKKTLSLVDSLEINVSGSELEKFKNSINEFSSLNCLILKGEAEQEEWSNLFKTIKLQPTILSIVFKENSFEFLPYGFENLFRIEQLAIQSNDDMDYFQTFEQFAQLPNLRNLTVEINSVFDLPENFDHIRNLSNITLINKNEFDTKNNINKPFTYDYRIIAGNNQSALLKYCSNSEIDKKENDELKKRYIDSKPKKLSTFENLATEFLPKYKNVSPPIKGIDVERSNYIINPSIENIIIYPSGTKILIPANAFVDSKGNPVTTNISLYYREFRDPIDILVSGIPMKYDSAGESNTFESAGMFELTASAANEPLSLAKGKNIDMNFVTTSADATYNFYAYDDEKGNWDYLNKPTSVESGKAIKMKIYSNSFNAYRNFMNYNYAEKDYTLFEERFKSKDYVYTNNFAPKIGSHRVYYTERGKTKGTRITQLLKIVGVRKLKSGDIVFKIKHTSKTHRELNGTDNLYFVSQEGLSLKDFRKTYVYKKYYNDMRIEDNGEGVTLNLKGVKSFSSINCNIGRLNYSDELKLASDKKSILKRYNKQLAYRSKLFDKDVKKGKMQYPLESFKNEEARSLRAYEIAKKEMSQEELNMSYKEWMNYYKQISTQDSIKNHTISTVVNSLSLSGLGIYNCDQIRRIKNPVEIFANYKTPTNEELFPTTAFIIEKGVNSVFQYSGYYGYSAQKIAFSNNKNAKNNLLIINQDGSVALFKEDEFSKNSFSDNSKFQFEVTPVDSKSTSLKGLKKLIGL